MKPAQNPQPFPVALLAGMMEDNGRVLFLVKKNAAGEALLELPCALLFQGENPVSVLSLAFAQQTGIDGQVHEIAFERRHNAGSRKRKRWVPVLVFKVTAKERAVKPQAPFSGFRWIPLKDACRERFSRNSEWMR